MNTSSWSARARLREAAHGRVVVGIVVVLVSVLVLPVPVWLVVLVVAMASRPQDTMDRDRGDQRALRRWITVSSVFVGAALISLVGKPVTGHGVQLLVWFALLPSIGVLFLLQGRRAHTIGALWWGATIAAITAGIVAIVQVGVFDAQRATGVTANSITFGNMALVLGAVSIALHRTIDLPTRIARSAALAAGASALAASILSGSRGGWLALPVVIVVLLWNARTEMTQRRSAHLAVGLIGVMVFANALSDGMPTQRASASVTNVATYSAHTPRSVAAASSEGARIEAWRSAGAAFREQPVTGVGWGNLAAHFERDVALGIRNERIATFDHAHNQLLGAAANGGVIGLVAMAALFAVPLLLFARAMASPDRHRQTLGLTGVVVIAAYIVFGLTEATLENLVPVTLLAVLVGALCSELDAVAGEPATAPERRSRRPEPSLRRRPVTPIAYGRVTPFGIHY